MSFMLAFSRDEIPKGAQWQYELKYDGYRAQLIWDGSTCSLLSRNHKNLASQFPEIVATCKHHFKDKSSIHLDGEIVLLENPGLADFHTLKRRHRLRSQASINTSSHERPAAFLVFDMLSVKNKPYSERKQELARILKNHHLPTIPAPHDERRIQLIPSTQDVEDIQYQTHLYRSEGIVAKTSSHTYKDGRSESWLKIKTPRLLTCFIQSYNPENGYFDVGVYKNGEAVTLGQCAHGFSKAEKESLVTIIKNNGEWVPARRKYDIEPSIVVNMAFTTYSEDFREPRFQSFQFDTPARQCTWEHWQNAALKWPERVSLTHPEKPLWSDPEICKRDFLEYTRTIAPYVLPHLESRLLTLVRYPHGQFGDAFFQKQCPEYAPTFVEAETFEDTDYIVCQHVDTLLWLANQLAIEWHIPFSLSSSRYVEEIVIDLDPPDAAAFSLAIEGANLLKEVFDQLQLESFVKFSGNKGLQVYVPLAKNQYTYEDTHPFTEAIGAYCLQNRPDLFTRERLKKKRGRKLYIDIPQHAFGKTIIAPYSLRGNKEALVALPLFWEEVSSDLDRTRFTPRGVQQRLLYEGCPFASYGMTANRLPDFSAK
ncbi:DNA ligase D [Natribacillus halophilus]|uniref:Bifunctional non-homologous end joining protein LigD n=1 Tax=Natribacillus halophilus TaxID=549003 RepID=A0A1G8R3P8_9BACI|nr:DNA ligase D [Natribacillus halophilus]SDJ11602.1 bifunctional non-homologous end joining protein LigD [Natribacillus halophilus]